MYDELYAAGAEEIVGATDITGYLPHYAGRLPQYAAGALQRAYAAGAHAALQNAPSTGNRIAYGGNLGTQGRPPREARLFPLGFNATAVAASASVVVTARPQILFRPQRLVISATVAADFMISDIRVGKDSQLVQAGEISPDAFSPDAVGVMVTFDTAQPGCDISLAVRNTDTVNPHNFVATMFGAAVQ